MPESCRLHPESPSTSTCEDCAAPLCPECTQSALGRSWCASCLSARVGVPRDASDPGARLKRPWLALLLSLFLPGLGQVYDGFVVRGIAQFGAWWLIFMVARGNLPGMPLEFAAILAVVGTWIWCARDARRTALEINARGYLATREEARSITRGPLGEQDMRFAGIGLVAIGVLLFAQEIGGFVLDAFRFAWPIGLIALGAWILRRAHAKDARESALDAEGVAG